MSDTMNGYENRVKVTAENIDELRDGYMPRDQGIEVGAGCEFWKFQHAAGFTGSACKWPSGRGALCLGGDSIWGDVDGYILTDDDGNQYDIRDGEKSIVE